MPETNMPKPRCFKGSIARGLLLCCFFFVLGAVAAQAQQPSEDIAEDTARGIKLYKDGNFRDAISALSEVVKTRSGDADAWYYLGLALRGEGALADAAQAFEKVIILRPEQADAHVFIASVLVLQDDIKRAGTLAGRALELGLRNAEVHYILSEYHLKESAHLQAIEEAEAAIKLDPTFTEAYLVKARALRQLYRQQESIAALSKYLSLNPEHDAELWREELTRWQEPLQAPQKPTGETANRLVFRPTEVTTKARLLSKPSPEYTEKARQAYIIGTVVITAVLSQTGEVTNIRVIQRLRGGLTTEAVRAARRIKFEPAIKDGQPVSQYIKVEYNFNIY
jgi:TonB family protein